MPSLQIKRQRNNMVDPKQVLRAHVDRLPPDKQREFVLSAFQLIAKRNGVSEAEIRPVTNELCRSESSNQPLQLG